MVKRKVVIDTNIIIDHIRLPRKGKSPFEIIVENLSFDSLISTATIQELFVGQSSVREDQETKIRKIINSIQTLDITPEIAELAGQIMRDVKPQMQFADAQIAATAILNKASLFTLNKKDFKGIKKLKLI